MLLALLLLSIGASLSAAEKPILHFSFITALSGGSESSGGIPIIDFALDEINNDTRILPNYVLEHSTILDSRVHIKNHGRSCMLLPNSVYL